MEVGKEGELSEYELMRERNIIENHDFMVKCGKLDYISYLFLILLANIIFNIILLKSEYGISDVSCMLFDFIDISP